MNQDVNPEKASRGVRKGRIRQSVCYWCFSEPALPKEWAWSLDKTCEVARKLGCESVELVDPVDWDTLRKYGLKCAITLNGVPGLFVRGFCNWLYHDEVITATKGMINACANSEGLCNRVIAFTGYKWRNANDPSSSEISLEEGIDSCVAGFKKLMPYAEEKGVQICLEHLNDKEHPGPDGKHHPMKGHPGYFGRDLGVVAQIVRVVNSPNLKLLYDVYHVQIENGDLIRGIQENRHIIGHMHAAGNPGRGELDETQEINYPAVMRALLAVGYTGYVGQEFIPTRDPKQSLTEAIEICDV